MQGGHAHEREYRARVFGHRGSLRARTPGASMIQISCHAPGATSPPFLTDLSRRVRFAFGLRGLPPLLVRHPPAVNLRVDPRGQAHGGERAVFETCRVEDEQVAPYLEPAIDDTDEITVTFGRTRMARHEATLLHARVGTREVGRRAAGRVIE